MHSFIVMCRARIIVTSRCVLSFLSNLVLVVLCRSDLPVGHPHQKGIGASGLVYEEAHSVVSVFT